MKRLSKPKRDDRSYHGRPKRDRHRQKALKRQMAWKGGPISVVGR